MNWSVVQLTKVNNMRFGSIIRRLASRNIYNMSRHTGGGDEAATRKTTQFCSIYSCSFHLLSPKVFASGTCTIDYSVNIDFHEIMVSLNVCVNECFVAPRSARVGDKYIKAAAEFFDNLLQRCFYFIARCNVDLIRSACSAT